MKRLDFLLLSPGIQEILHRTGTEADAAGVRAFIVGGVVRDLLLKAAVTDVDIVIEGDAPVFARRLAKKLGASLRVHEKFRTASLLFKDGMSLDIASARRESYARPGALPDVVPGSIADDLLRRDFTINALAAGLNADDRGVVRDDLEGLGDLEARLVRVMHMESFRDDPTRILRAARYAARFGFQLDALTEQALNDAVAAGALTTITPVRYFLELGRILDAQDPAPALDLLVLWDAVRYVPYAATDRQRLIQCRGGRDERLAALLQELPRAKTEEVLVAFNISRTQRQAVMHKITAAP